MKKVTFLLTILAMVLFATPAYAHTVQQGDTMSKIARENGLTLQELAEINPNITDLNLIYIGQNVHTTRTTDSIELSAASEPIPSINPENASEVTSTNTETIAESTPNQSLSDSEIDLLARLVRAEAQTEPFEGKVAVACVVLNRIESSQFPDTLKEVIYAPRQFQPVSNGAINKPADEESINAVIAALTQQREMAPGALFFYNPSIATSRWLDTRETTLVIGQHVFKK
jgi:N-acetylmuramoyl-L-alanine amidase